MSVPQPVGKFTPVRQTDDNQRNLGASGSGALSAVLKAAPPVKPFSAPRTAASPPGDDRFRVNEKQTLGLKSISILSKNL